MCNTGQIKDSLGCQGKSATTEGQNIKEQRDYFIYVKPIKNKNKK